MAREISTELLAGLSELVAARMGLHFPPERWRDLARGVESAARELDFADAESCAGWLLASSLTKRQFETLASHLTIGETYFFRERQALEALRERILPGLIRARRGREERLRIWSAACSTGEEAYSVAMLLDRHFPDIKNWQLDIIATDINARSLGKAEAGVYGEWSFRAAPAWVKERYFERVEGGYELKARVKRMVKFAYLNLAEDAYPSLLNNTNAMDVILCRNALMYFGAEQARRVVSNFSHALVAGGWLIVSQSELSSLMFADFASVNFPGAILYQKSDAETQTAAAAFNQTVDEAVSLLPLFDFADARETEKFPMVDKPVGAGLVAARKGATDSTQTEMKAARAGTSPAPTKISSVESAENPLTGYTQALARYERGLYREAREQLLELVRLEPENSPALVLLARASANLGDLSEALRWCERAVAADKMNAGVHFLRATVLQEQRQTAEAVKSLRRALYLDCDFALAHFALGNLEREQGKRREARKHFANALALLDAQGLDVVLPEAEGMTAGRLAEIVRQALNLEAAG